MSEDSSTTRDKEGHPQVGADQLQEIAIEILARVVTSMKGAPRTGQQTMVKEICRALSGRHVVIQAGTGTGKSFGYLVPVIADCVLNKHRALISTATLALQRQITVHDAPVVLEAVKKQTGKTAKVSVLKGWNNYVCLHRADGGMAESGLFDAEMAMEGGKTTDLGAQILRVREWAAQSSTGDRDDLVPGVSDQAWQQVSVSKRECLGKSCPLLEQCFPQRAREKALMSEVVVTNHSMVGLQAMNGVDLFGPIDAVVVDEAHALAERVRSQACQHISTGIIRRVSKRLYRLVKADTHYLEQVGALFGAALSGIEDGLIEQRLEKLKQALSSLDQTVRDLYTQIEQSHSDQAEKLMARGSLDELGGFLEAWNQDPDRSITWIQRDARSGTEELVVGPLDVAGPIGKRTLGSKPAVLTSATLTVGGSFQSISHDCGLALSDVPWNGVDVGTPFDPARQGILYIAQDLPAPGREGPGEEVLDRLVELARASRGGMLALFSSWRGAQAGAEALREHTKLNVLLQGEETTSALVERFRDDVDSCLVATLGLWQGVDVAGPSCRLVTLDRIPFPHPNDPVFKARSREAERRGLNGFRTVQLPYAALLMAQGAGRLLRSVHDRGMVAVLDSRVVTKSYGSFIRSTLPPLWPTVDHEVALAALRRLGETTKRT